jgi:hypothetical protein
LCLDGSLNKSDIEIDCVSYTDPGASALAKAVSDYFQDVSGAAGADTIDFVIWSDGGDNAPIPEQDGGDVFRYSVKLQFSVWHH